MAGHFGFVLNADRQTASTVNSSLDEDTNAAPFIAPDEHAISIDIAETKDVLSYHRDFLYLEGSSGIRVDSEALTAEAGGQAECRICQEEEDVEKLETPCACSGSMKYAHRICVQRWCYAKGDTVCEICHQPYSNGYKTIPQPSHTEVTPRPLDGEPEITVSNNEVDYARLVTMGATGRDFQHPDSDLDKYGYMFVLSFFFWLILFTYVFNLRGVADSDSAVGMAFLGAGGLCCFCYVMVSGARVVVIHRRLRHEIAASAGIHRRRRQRHEVARGADVAQWVPNLELATGILEHPTMVAIEVEGSRERGA